MIEVLQIRPVWVERLQNTTRYEKQDIEDPAENLNGMEKIKIKFLKNTLIVTVIVTLTATAMKVTDTVMVTEGMAMFIFTETAAIIGRKSESSSD